MKKSLRFVLSTFLAMTALLVTSAGSGAVAEPEQGGDVGVMGIGQRTYLKYNEVWIRFRPNANYGEHLVLNPGTDVATICKDVGADREMWNVVYDHDRKFIGWTHAYNLSVQATEWCGVTGRLSYLEPAFDPAWVHLHPKEDWAYDYVYNGQDLTTFCWVDHGQRWQAVLARQTQTVGFTYNSYFRDYPNPAHCTYS